MTTPLHELGELGQSPWIDSITREWLDSGELEAMLDRLGVRGLTSNPSIFAQAISSSAYDADIRRYVAEGLDDRTIFEHIEVDDLRRACDVLAGVHRDSDGVDGMVSIEVEPDLAADTDATIARGRELWAAVDRPNLMVKVPATPEGMPAIEQLLYEGINVNVTLLFSVDAYVEVLERFVAAIERRDAEGLPIDAVHSVASFFVSRVDSAVDPLLAARGEAGMAIAGRVAVANAVKAWGTQRDVFSLARWKALEARGANRQRILCASTGTKNPDYSDVLYVDDLIVPGSVNTMPLATMEAVGDHGIVDVAIVDTREADGVLATLEALGIDLDEVTDKLLAEGVAAFEKSYVELLSSIASRRAAVGASS
jgi:transaldolase